MSQTQKSELHVFSGELIERAIIPWWRMWVLYVTPWHWKKIAPGVFVRRGSTWFSVAENGTFVHLDIKGRIECKAAAIRKLETKG